MAALYRNKQIDFRQKQSTLAQLEVWYSFLHDPPTEWLKNQDLISGQCIVRGLRVVNDSDERGAVLIQQHNDSITIHEDQKQYLLQDVENHQWLYLKARKVFCFTNIMHIIPAFLHLNGHRRAANLGGL